jgi:hypothetical protein
MKSGNTHLLSIPGHGAPQPYSQISASPESKGALGSTCVELAPGLAVGLGSIPQNLSCKPGHWVMVSTSCLMLISSPLPKFTGRLSL